MAASSSTDNALGKEMANVVASAAEKEPEFALGIDFGTDTLVCSLAQVGRPGEYPVLVRNATSELSTDAVVCYAEQERLIGPAAVSHLSMQPQETIEAVKCFLGALEPLPAVGYELHEEQLAGGAASRRAVTVNYRGEQQLSLVLEQVAASLLRRLHSFALHDSLLWQAHPQPASVPAAVLAVPNEAPESYRRALVDAARVAGMRVVALVEEGTAAALCYAVSRRLAAGTEEVALFCDVGAAFTNLTLARVTPRRLAVLRSTGERLGGRDFDGLLFAHFAEEILKRHGVRVQERRKDAGKLLRAIQHAKTVLSTGASASIELECLREDLDVSLPFPRSLFSEVCRPLLDRFKGLVRSVLATCPSDGPSPKIEILGSALILPLIQEALVQAANGAELNRHIDASTSVAIGAGIVAALGGLPDPLSIALPPSRDDEEEAAAAGTSSYPVSSSNAEPAPVVGALDDGVIAQLKDKEEELERNDEQVQTLSNVRNSFEQWIYRTRDQLKAASSAKPEVQATAPDVQAFLTEVEEWLLYGEAEALPLEELTGALESRRQAFSSQFTAFAEWLRIQEEEKQRLEAEYAEAVRNQGPRQGRDKVEKPVTNKERIEAAIKRKEQGNTAFTSVDFKTAILRYGQGIEALKEIQGELEPEQKEQADNLLFLCNLNSAACSLKFKNGSNKAIAFATAALDINGPSHRFGEASSVKALHRRASGHLQLKHHEDAQKDLNEALKLEPTNAPIRQLLTQVETTIQKMEAERQQMFQKMFA